MKFPYPEQITAPTPIDCIVTYHHPKPSLLDKLFFSNNLVRLDIDKGISIPAYIPIITFDKDIPENIKECVKVVDARYGELVITVPSNLPKTTVTICLLKNNTPGAIVGNPFDRFTELENRIAILEAKVGL